MIEFGEQWLMLVEWKTLNEVVHPHKRSRYPLKVLQRINAQKFSQRILIKMMLKTMMQDNPESEGNANLKSIRF